jgi:hypothetical protein
MSPRHNEESLAEPLIMASVGTKGYLKFPKAFTDRFDFVAETLPNPTPKLVVKNGVVQLVYEWTEEQMNEAAANAPAARAVRRNNKKEE